jgi:hypothetical protein
MVSIMARVLALYAQRFYRPPYSTRTRYGQMRAMLDEIMHGGDKRPIILSRKERRRAQVR